VSYRTQPAARTADYVVAVRDRNGLLTRTDVRLQLDAVLRQNNTPINDDDEVPKNANLSLLLLSPAPIANPQTDLALTVNGTVQPFTAVPSPADASGREWILSWVHADYPIDDYTVTVSIQNGGSVSRRFRVTAASGQLAIRNLIPFPNPFDNS